MTNYQSLFPVHTKFLVTGCAGFIGSHLVETLLEEGFDVVGLDDLSNGFKTNIEPFLSHPKFSFVEGNIRDYELCLSLMNGIDYVLHQAAWGSVPRSIEMPRLYEEINVQGTLNIFEAARHHQVKRVVYASSSSVYGDSEILPKVEGQEGHVLSPYAMTKKMNEAYGHLYTSIYQLETIGLRYFNVFGPRQNPNGAYAAVIPKFTHLILNGKSPTIYGDGTQSRDFTYIKNVIQANLKACLAPQSSTGQTFNIAYGESIVLTRVFDVIKNSLGKPHLSAQYRELRRGDIMHSHADLTSAKVNLNYQPVYSFEQGIQDYLKKLIEQ
jgi:UDP-N-acetylglucosamine 4-epimerase